MLIISHRGNLVGPDPLTENRPDHIKHVLEMCDCEVDVWMEDNMLFLGHDKPQYFIKPDFLTHANLWCHAKNLKALEFLIDNHIRCFYHDKDDFTLTSDNYIWTYPGCKVGKKSVIVDTSINWIKKNYNCYGVCVDYVLQGHKMSV